MVDPVDQGLELPGFGGHLDVNLKISRLRGFIIINIIIIIITLASHILVF